MLSTNTTIIITLFCLVIWCLTLHRIHWWIATLPLLMVFAFVEYDKIRLSPEKCFIILSLPAVILSFLMHDLKRIKSHRIDRNLVIAFMAFLILLLTTQIIHSGANSAQVIFVSNYLAKGILVYLVVRFINKRHKFELCLKTTTISLFIIVMLGITEIILAKNMFLFRYDKGSLAFAMSEFTPLINPNLTARYIVILLPFPVLSIYYFHKDAFMSTVASIALIGSSLVIFSTLSRAGLTAFIAEIIVFLVFCRRQIYKRIPWLLPGIALAFTGVLYAAREHILERIGNASGMLLSMFRQSPSECSRRVRSFLACWETIKENPLVGVGLEKITEHLTRHGGAIKSDGHLTAQQPHGGFLFFTVIGGLLLLLSFLVLVRAYWRYLARERTKKTLNTHKWIVCCATASLTGILITSLTANPFHLNIMWLTIGLFISGINIERQQPLLETDCLNLSIT